MNLWGIVWYNNGDFNFIYVDALEYLWLSPHIGSNLYVRFYSDYKDINKIVKKYDWNLL